MIKHNKYIILGYWSFIIFSLAVVCIISAFLNMWTLVYPILLLGPCIWTIFMVRMWFQNFMQKKVLVSWSATKTITVSIWVHILLTLGLILPVLTGVLINSFISDTFNIYMLLIFFTVSVMLCLLFMYMDNKHTVKVDVKEHIAVKE